MANAPYKLRVKDQFVCFSPETFITIEGNTIHTFPMKGTIDPAKKLLEEFGLLEGRDGREDDDAVQGSPEGTSQDTE